MRESTGGVGGGWGGGEGKNSALRQRPRGFMRRGVLAARRSAAAWSASAHSQAAPSRLVRVTVR